MPQKVKNPSWLPVISSALCLAISLAILLVSNLRTAGPLIYLAYICTPLMPILGLSIARSRDSVARSNIFFDIGKSQKIIRVVTLISFFGFLLAIIVVWEIASRWSQQ